MVVYHGSYIGNSTNPKSITTVGFKPDLVIIKRIGSTNVGEVPAYYATSAMPAGYAVTFREDLAYETNRIISLDSSGFTVSDSEYVNFSGDSYYYICVKDNGAKDFAVGVFTGDGADNHSISGLSFQPDYVTIHTNTNITGAHTFSCSTSTNKGFMWYGGTNRSDLFTSLDATGFTVNNGSSSGGNLINVNGAECSYFCFKNVPGKCLVQEWTGDGTDNRDIALTDAGLTPVFCMLKGDNSGNAIGRFKQNTGDQSQEIAVNSVVWSDCIQSFGTGTFQVGTQSRVNENGVKFSGLFLANDFVTYPRNVLTPYRTVMVGDGMSRSEFTS